MRQILTLSLWLITFILLMVGIGNAQHSPPVIPPAPIIPPVVLFYSQGQEPTIQRMPGFAYLGTRPLQRDDKISGSVRYSATGRNLFDRVLEYHQKTMLEKKWDPKFMRMLVVKKIKNRSFSTSGSVSASFSNTESENSALQTLSKNTTSSLYGSGSIAPSFSQSWTSESYDIWFFRVSE